VNCNRGQPGGLFQHARDGVGRRLVRTADQMPVNVLGDRRLTVTEATTSDGNVPWAKNPKGAGQIGRRG
jgi:hypothetical protein